MLGHEVVLMDARQKGGGLNEFGIAAYKTVDGFAQAEIDWLLRVGGITVEYGRALGRDVSLGDLAAAFDAVFLGIGLGGVNALAADGADRTGVRPAVDFIAELRQAGDLSALPVGRRVVVVGGGMTAIDAAIQSRLLGAEEVTILYRRGRERMGASGYEQELAATKGVRIVANAVPTRVGGNGAVGEVAVAWTGEGPDGLEQTGEGFELEADQVLVAIGQCLAGVPEELAIEGGKIAVTGPGRTSAAKVWAGGDCASGGDDLTVTAVAEGRDAAMDIHSALTGPS
jgi:glutamate synthase (NADPH/NADH) small chain